MGMMRPGPRPISRRKPRRAPVCNVPRAFEVQTLPPCLYTANPLDGMTDQPLLTAVLTRAAADTLCDGSNVAIGVAYQSGSPVGVLAVLTADTNAVAATLPLIADQVVMTCPRAVLLCNNPTGGTAAIVVGNVESGEPAVAYVPLRPCAGPVVIYVSDDYATGELYTDVTWTPCGKLLVVGSAVNDATGFRTATAIILHANTLDAESPRAWLDSTTSTFADDATTEAVSVGIAENQLVVVGVQVTNSTGSTLWCLQLDATNSTLTQILPWDATNYNSSTTTMLRMAAGVTALRVLRVLVAGALVYVVSSVSLDTDAGLPANGVQVSAFNPDTNPNPTYGIDGMSVWFDRMGAATYPMDAVFAPHTTSVLVTGNTVPVPGNGLVLNTPCFPYLEFQIPTIDAGPRVFVVEFRDGCTASCEGCAAVLLNDLCSGCAPLRLATAITLTAANGCLVLGAVSFHPGCPSQDAVLLVVFMSLLPTARVLNCAPAPPVVGCVTVDGLCCDTTLRVRGGVTIGCAADGAGPGTLRFNPTTARLELYDGTMWLELAIAAPV